MRCFAVTKLLWGLTLALALTAFGVANPLADKEKSQWHPEKTRAFIVCLTIFKGDKKATFSQDDRLDGHLVEVLKKRGVPHDQIVFLKDDHATTKNIRTQFTEFLRKSNPGETLLFYFGSHGSYTPKTGEHWFVSYDGFLPFKWVFEAIEHDFKGANAVLTADCCFSGGIVDLARERKGNVAYACLSSTFSQQTATSGWRFVQCLLRTLEGNPVVDLDADGHISLNELATYTEHYMAFAAEGRPMFVTTNGISPRLALATARGKKKDQHVGNLVEVKSGNKWWPAEILDVKGAEFRIHYTSDTKTVNDAWVKKDAVRPPVHPHFVVGAKVEVQSSSTDKWQPATVEKVWESLFFCRCEGLSPAYDEWFGPSKIRPRR